MQFLIGAGMGLCDKAIQVAAARLGAPGRAMPTGRLICSACSPLHDGEFVMTAKAIADFLEEAAPVIVKQRVGVASAVST